MEKPANSLITAVHGQSPASARNFIITQALQNECTHVFFMDDDIVMPPNTIERLLAHDKEIISGLYLMRSFPHYPVLFDQAFEDGMCKFMYLTPDKQGVIPVVNCGFGMVLIKIEVFKKMQKPWVTLGEIEKDGWCDDVSFFNRARKAGFQIYCDLTTIGGHMVNVTAYPNFVNGMWITEYKHPQGAISFPQHVPELANMEVK